MFFKKYFSAAKMKKMSGSEITHMGSSVSRTVPRFKRVARRKSFGVLYWFLSPQIFFAKFRIVNEFKNLTLTNTATFLIHFYYYCLLSNEHCIYFDVLVINDLEIHYGEKNLSYRGVKNSLMFSPLNINSP